MKKKIFNSIFVTSLSVLIVCLTMFFVVVGNHVNLTNTTFAITVFLAIACTVLLVIIARSLAEHIVSPIEKINLEAPLEKKNYKELVALLEKIDRQNKIIRKQTKQVTRAQQEFSVITENMSEGVVVVDKSANLLMINSAVNTLLGTNIKAQGQSIFEINPSEEFAEIVKNTLENSTHSEANVSFGDRMLNFIANPVISEGKTVGAVIVILDISEKSMREELRREFTANVSHELKTPLTSISGFAELMKTGTVPMETVIDFSSSIYDEAKRLISLVNDIIKVSVLDENSVSLDKEKIDLQAIVNTTIERLHALAKSMDITLETDTTPANVNGNYQILDEMVYNLVENAIKYNKNGGSVKVTIRNLAQSVVLSVHDTGIGIDKSEQEKIFERFYRVDKSHSKEIGGTGLGLSIVKHAAVYHDAEIEIESELDKGTVISVIFKR